MTYKYICIMMYVVTKEVENMNKYPKLADKNKCTGCSACEQVCSKHSINMVQDIEGFLYPKVNNESCVGCLKCEKICPLNNPAEYKKNDNQECYCGIAKDEIWKSSTSGGAFTVICEEWGDDKTIVFGAEFDQNNYRIMHSYAEGVGKIDKYRGSKYVQSDMGDTITQIIKFLYEEKKVIFSGTPCQVAGVLAAVKDTKNLLCIDIVCHGVGSPKVFFEYCKYKKKIKG